MTTPTPAATRRIPKKGTENKRSGEEKVDLPKALKSYLYDAAGNQIQFGDIFTTQKTNSEPDSTHSRNNTLQTSIHVSPRPRLLLIFIRHFFCGNCQEYLNQLAAVPTLSETSLAEQNLRLVIIGCGAPSLIESYRQITNIPNTWELYVDPSTQLYRMLGMHRTYSLGDKNPAYIRKSLTGNMIRSFFQSMRRIPEGDALSAGDWDVNGGEFLFQLRSDSADSSNSESWDLGWCHRMLNSRDHTEVNELLHVLGLSSTQTTETNDPTSILSSPVVLEEDSSLDEIFEKPIKATPRSNLRRSLSLRKQSWIGKTNLLGRSLSLRPNVHVRAH